MKKHFWQLSPMNVYTCHQFAIVQVYLGKLFFRQMRAMILTKIYCQTVFCFLSYRTERQKSMAHGLQDQNPQLSYRLFTLHSPNHCHIALFGTCIKPGSELQLCLRTVLRRSQDTKIVLLLKSSELRFCCSQLQKIAVCHSNYNRATVLQQLRSWFTIKLR